MMKVRARKLGVPKYILSIKSARPEEVKVGEGGEYLLTRAIVCRLNSKRMAMTRRHE